MLFKAKTKKDIFKPIKPVSEFQKTTYTHTYEPYIENCSTSYYEIETNNENNYTRKKNFIWYNVNNDNTLKICDIYADGIDPDYHHGTELVIALLGFLKQPFEKIYGVLSWADAESTKGWRLSIPFYHDLLKYIYERLGLIYEFHLFDNMDYSNDATNILLPLEHRKEAVDGYIKSHLYDDYGCSKKRNGSFYYLLSPRE